MEIIGSVGSSRHGREAHPALSTQRAVDCNRPPTTPS
jgi:hypothetical protein